MPEFRIPTVATGRLTLRPFVAADRPDYAALRADPDVVRFLPGGEALVPFANEIAESRIAAFRDAWSRGYGVWAVEETATGAFVGQAGLASMERSGEVEVLYALARPFWGLGYAREAAAAALRFGFEQVGLERIVAFVVPENAASSRVLEAVGLRATGDTDYNGFRVRGYEIAVAEWRRTAGGS
ncbi:GNAT family N-acetyltransferase [Thalassobaculum sp.]|uniref:GNAT family N-acetyltransferase n=1 Tax=Thalassobaculum sp. TaxID=2022740 RepID=UPI0032ED7E9E